MVPIIYSKIKIGTIIGIKTALRSARDFDLSLMVLTHGRDALPLSRGERAFCRTGCEESAWDETFVDFLFLRRTIHACHDSGIVNEYKPATQAWTLSYLLTDHLSSVVAVTDGTGALISQQRYLPFGGERTNIGTISQTDYGYTGQRDLEMGLMDYKARFYSPLLGRFTQPDTITPGGPQGLNRYSYVINNPIILNDPAGHCYTDSNVWIPAPGDGDCDFSTSTPDSDSDDEYEDGDDGVEDDLGQAGSKGPGLNMPVGYINSDLCPPGNLFCHKATLSSKQLGAINYILKNAISAYQIGALILGVIALLTAGTIVLPIVFGVPAAVLAYEAYAMGDLSDTITEMQTYADNNGGTVDVAYYQGGSDLVPGLTYEGDDQYAYGFTTLTGLLIIKNELGIP